MLLKIRPASLQQRFFYIDDLDIRAIQDLVACGYGLAVKSAAIQKRRYFLEYKAAGHDGRLLASQITLMVQSSSVVLVSSKLECQQITRV